MRLSQLGHGVQFVYRDSVYVRDFEGRDGGGRMAIKNVDTGEKEMVSGNLEVQVYEKPKKPTKKSTRYDVDTNNKNVSSSRYPDFTPLEDFDYDQ